MASGGLDALRVVEIVKPAEQREPHAYVAHQAAAVAHGIRNAAARQRAVRRRATENTALKRRLGVLSPPDSSRRPDRPDPLRRHDSELGTEATVGTSHPHSLAEPKRVRQGDTMNDNEHPITPAAKTSGTTNRAARVRRTAAIRNAAIPAGVAVGALMLLADAGSAFAGMDLGNHNETLLTHAAVAKPSHGRRLARRRLALSALVVASFGVTAAFVNDGTSNTRHSAYPGQYCSSSGGGRNCPQRP
jgi:hypothetical protein